MNLCTCACGCGEAVPQKKTGRPRRWVSDAHRMRAARQASDVRKRPTRPSSESEQPGSGQAEGPGPPRFIEVCNTRRTIRGRPVTYAGPFPGFRTVELLAILDDQVKVRYLGPDPMEEVVPAEKVTGVVRDGRIDRDPEAIAEGTR